jgi:1,2-phenylacetyl-CoA epoxidase catalytic subunit
MYQNSVKDYDDSFAPEDKPEEQIKVESEQEVVDIVRDYSKEIAEHIQYLSMSVPSPDNQHIIRVNMWDSHRDDIVLFLEKILNRSKK